MLILAFTSVSGQALLEIRYEGLKKSKVSYLSRHIKSKVGAVPDLKTIQEDVQQLRNLHIISKIDYRLDTVKNGQILVFEIEESIHLFPLFSFGGVKNNVWFQLGFTELNLQGKGQQLTMLYRNNDRRHNGTIYYKIPYIKGSNWGASMSLLRWASVEPLYFNNQAVFYDYDNTSLSPSIIHSFTANHRLEIGGTYFIENYVKNIRHQNEMTPGPEVERQRKFLLKLVHQFSRISYHHLHTRGWDNVLNIQRIWNLEDQSTFNIVFNDTRFFKRIGVGRQIAARLRLGLSTNNNSPFAPFVIDSHVNIRGAGNRIDRGTGMGVLNLEYRQILYEWSKLAIQFVGFSDIGTWRQPGGELNDFIDSENVAYFAGGGFRLIYKRAHNAVIRVDYGVNLLNSRNRGFVLGLGQYF